jgi:hypothetical protein
MGILLPLNFIQPIPGWNHPEAGATGFKCFSSVSSDKYDYS